MVHLRSHLTRLHQSRQSRSQLRKQRERRPRRALRKNHCRQRPGVTGSRRAIRDRHNVSFPRTHLAKYLLKKHLTLTIESWLLSRPCHGGLAQELLSQFWRRRRLSCQDKIGLRLFFRENASYLRYSEKYINCCPVAFRARWLIFHIVT